jgi:hypothetical protein
VSELEDAVFRAPPREFTAARDALVVWLRQAGRPDEAKAVKAWRRPTVPVWLWNRMALDGEACARAAVEAADALAAGIAKKADLSQASATLRGAATQVVVRARALAVEVRIGFSPAQERELADLVQALPWHEGAREEARHGRLHVAPPPVDPLVAMSALASSPRPVKPAPPPDEADQAARAELAGAEAELARAQRLAENARASLERAEKQLEDSRRTAEEALRELKACEKAVDEARARRDARRRT